MITYPGDKKKNWRTQKSKKADKAAQWGIKPDQRHHGQEQWQQTLDYWSKFIADRKASPSHPAPKQSAGARGGKAPEPVSDRGRRHDPDKIKQENDEWMALIRDKLLPMLKGGQTEPFPQSSELGTAAQDPKNQERKTVKPSPRGKAQAATPPPQAKTEPAPSQAKTVAAPSPEGTKFEQIEQRVKADQAPPPMAMEFDIRAQRLREDALKELDPKLKDDPNALKLKVIELAQQRTGETEGNAGYKMKGADGSEVHYQMSSNTANLVADALYEGPRKYAQDFEYDIHRAGKAQGDPSDRYDYFKDSEGNRSRRWAGVVPGAKATPDKTTYYRGGQGFDSPFERSAGVSNADTLVQSQARGYLNKGAASPLVDMGENFDENGNKRNIYGKEYGDGMYQLRNMGVRPKQ